ncbi:head-tail joining protein [Orrella marina]|uniref:Uncharacterized protein n=1 Tax=Orrella marina TaxID=2163011 RepID=A0A2R4XF06_9BURK|nr:hypothetical protein [Orrella marina]AWB32375.1 hypothetical protein DBV39_00125 [Orrella marina]
MWDNSVFDRAFDRLGLRQKVEPHGFTHFEPFMARFERPQEIMLEDQIHTTDYSIEYTYADCPGLKIDDQLKIGSQVFKVHQPPTRQGDGYYAVAQLEEVT